MSIPDTSSEADVPEPPRSPSKTVSPKRRPPSEGPTTSATLESVIDFLHDVPGTALKPVEAKKLVHLIQKCIKGERHASEWLLRHVGQVLDAVNVAGLISILQEQIHPPKPEPFRFQSAPPPPSREASPATTSTPAATPRRTLKRNPNGPYRWEGAGSAKATRRNRYASPAFGTPQLTPEKSKTDGDKKRRKVDEEASSNESSSTSKHSFPASTPQTPTPRTNGPTAPKITIPASPSKLKAPALLKPTTPSQPSPLRQAWSTSPSSSQEDLTKMDQVQPSPPKQSSAASFMSSIIQEVTPPKKPDLSNPYQTASPLAKVAPPRRSARRTRATGRPTTPEKEKEEKVAEEKPKDLPAQAIIEATLPKGSKRSRPPVNLERSKSPEAPVNGSASNGIEDDEDEVDRTHKKAKSVNGFLSPFGSSSTLFAPQEKKDEEPKAAQPSNQGAALGASPAAPSALTTNGLPSFNPPKSATAPSRPSKLRFSYQPDPNSGPSSPETKNMDTDTEPSAPPPPTISSTFSNLPSAPTTSSSLLSRLSSVPETNTKEDSKMDDSEDTSAKPATPSVDPKTRVLKMAESSLPTFTFTISHKTDGFALSRQRDAAKSKPANVLPTFDFSRTALGTSVIASGSGSGSSSSSAAAPAKGGFNWAGAGLKPSTAAGSSWTCSLCMLTNPASAAEKCTICDAPAPGKAAASSTSATTSSTFSSNAAAAPAAPKGGFNWAATGLEPTSASSGWTCGLCGLSNPASATEKCTICEAPAPKAAGASSSTPSTAAAPAPKGGFNWAATGLKPTSGSGWTCGLCGLSNPASATEKCTVCDAPAPSAAGSSSSTTSSTAAPAPKGGFDWAATGLKPPSAAAGGSSSWTCGLCGLSNPASATSKCTVCEEPRR
ncbi:hypothetical protein EST38_g8081 [Candolleomyces aberdarensis]|uniref:RanBP2-type domain-containing protein n=1 Tax=Candolleomyces aberdarensis TaxID=2316362 RepID=A0A4Q2DDL0_9AGAR|nr:hypothetical protein EST38_g8081 [Candolleomyces aberdarensis]